MCCQSAERSDPEGAADTSVQTEGEEEEEEAASPPAGVELTAATTEETSSLTSPEPAPTESSRGIC